MPSLQVTSHTEAETLALASRLAPSFHAGDVIVLSGPLGAGKTVFVRGLVEGRGLDITAVTSPSFAMVNEYPGDVPIYHVDLYRIGSLHELRELGWDEYLSRPGIVVIEWGERAAAALPGRYYHITIDVISDSERQFTFDLVTA